MFELFVMGGVLFMSIITIVFSAALIVAIKTSLEIFNGNTPYQSILTELSLVRSIGLLALVIGILGQMIGLYNAFDTIEHFEGEISSSILAAGLKISSITTIWGLICFIISMLISFGLGILAKKNFDPS